MSVGRMEDSDTSTAREATDEVTDEVTEEVTEAPCSSCRKEWGSMCHGSTTCSIGHVTCTAVHKECIPGHMSVQCCTLYKPVHLDTHTDRCTPGNYSTQNCKPRYLCSVHITVCQNTHTHRCTPGHLCTLLYTRIPVHTAISLCKLLYTPMYTSTLFYTAVHQDACTHCCSQEHLYTLMCVMTRMLPESNP